MIYKVIAFKKRFLIGLSLLLVWIMPCYAGLQLEDVDGHPIVLESLHGKWVFINYWASWCGPCVDEIEELNHFYAANNKNQLALFAVNFDAPSLSQQRQLIKQFDIHYPSLNPKSLRSLHLEEIKVVPVTYVFNPQGHLATILYGGQTRRSLQKFLKGTLTN